MITLTELNKSEALRYMGHRGDIPDALNKIILDCEEKLLKVIHPSFIYRCFNIECIEEGIRVINTSLILKGTDIKNHLEGCDKAVLMCATIGADADRLIRRTEITDISSAFAMDALASTAIEQVCSEADKIISSDLSDFFMTWRFSPGYGDFPIETQRDFLEVMNAQKRIGLCTAESNMLMPVKSVTAVAGVSKIPVPKRRRGCAGCNMAGSCQYRKKGGHCEF